MPDLVNGNSQELPASQSPDSRSGQEPAASQVPSARDSSGSSSSSAPSGAEEKDAIIESLRRENAKYRKDDKRLAELEKLYQDAENAKLSEKERLEKQLSDYQTKLADAERSRQETAVRADIKLAAAELGMKLELARRILDYAAIEYDERGDPTNVAELLRATATELEISVNGSNGSTPLAGNGKTPAATARPLPTSVGGTPANPARSATSGAPVGGWSWEAISSLTKDQYEGLTPAQRHAMSQFISSHPKR